MNNLNQTVVPKRAQPLEPDHDGGQYPAWRLYSILAKVLGGLWGGCLLLAVLFWLCLAPALADGPVLLEEMPEFFPVGNRNSAWGDVDGDGDLDLASRETSGQTSIYLRGKKGFGS